MRYYIEYFHDYYNTGWDDFALIIYPTRALARKDLQYFKKHCRRHKFRIRTYNPETTS